MMRALSLSIALFATVLAGCANPVQDARITALGPEDPAVPPSNIHRPGQPCLLCHGPYKGASPEMSVAGTVYAYPFDPDNPKDDPIPVQDVLIEVSDSFGVAPPIQPKTDCAGNFYLTTAEWNPSFPLRVAIRYPVAGEAKGERHSMGTRISRDGSCAGCHKGEPNQGSPGWIYCTQHTDDGPQFDPPNKCAPTKGH